MNRGISGRRIAVATVVLIALFLLAVHVVAVAPRTAEESRAIEAGYEAARIYDAPVRRFLELYLRVAGLAWVAVEWIAAVYLIRGYRMLRQWMGEEAPA